MSLAILRRPYLLVLAALLALTALPGAAWASRYRVDLLVFLDNGAVGNERPIPALLPQPGNAIDPDDGARLGAAGITMLPASAFGLDHALAALRYSRQFHPLLKLCWIQDGQSSGTSLRIHEGTPIPLGGLQVQPVDGSVALYTGTFLHLVAHLVYTTTDASGAVVSYHLNETRRVKFDELHYLDSPRLGVLARVTKVN